jgi:hypothetical protein
LLIQGLILAGSTIIRLLFPRDMGGTRMAFRTSLSATTLTAALSLSIVGGAAHDASKYPDLTAQWTRGDGSAQWDQSKPGGLRQQPPLTPEYQAIWEANIAAVAAGGEGYNPHAYCIPAGLPRMMIAYEPLDVIVTAEVTYIRDYFNEFRRIFTDGRAWPTTIKPSYGGYSIGKWEDSDGDGAYDTLAVETRGFKGPRTFEASGIPLHSDNQTVIKERIHLDKADRDVLLDDITTIDHALTRPWAVTRKYFREHMPLWPDFFCNEANNHVKIGKETYVLSAERHLMPTRKDQPPPDLRNFNQPEK